MIGEQKTKDEGYVSVATKVPVWVADLLTILAHQRGMEVYELLQLLVNGFITAAKANGPLSPQMKTLIEMLQTDTSWKGAFSFTGLSGSTDVEQAILIMRQRDQAGRAKPGYGIAMIDHAFCGGTTMTLCVDDIFERILKVSMPGLYNRLDRVGQRLCCTSHRETLTLLSEYMDDSINKEEELSEMPGYGEYHEYGKRIEYEKKYKRKPHRTPDTIENVKPVELPIHFDPSDVPDLPELQDWEGEHRQHGDDLPEGMTRPFDQEW